MTADTGYPTVLALLDTSNAFDTVDHTIFFLRSDFSCTLLVGLSMSHWEHECLDNSLSHLAVHNYLPSPFTIYMLPLGHVISRHVMSFHCYADESELYIKTAPKPFCNLLAHLEVIKTDNHTFPTVKQRKN